MSKLNRKLIEKMIKRIESKPRGFDQDVLYAEADERAPCGTVACLAGEAYICSATKPEEVLRLIRNGGSILGFDPHAAMGINPKYGVFHIQGQGWPEPYRSQYPQAKTYKARAAVAANFLRAILRTDGKILESK